MKDLFKKVGEFNDSFGVKESISVTPQILDDKKMLYHGLMVEELEEYFDAVVKKDTVEVADALVDMLYVLIGMFRKHGIDAYTASLLFEEVHNSNMSKLGKDGKPIYREDGKVLKGESFFNPNLKDILDGTKGI